jgi:hypothetical protein
MPLTEKGGRQQIKKAPFILLSLSVLLWIAGVASGESTRVLEQAWQVCLSCIGIG